MIAEQQFPLSRRALLRIGAQATAAGVASSLMPLSAAPSSGRAAVCIYLFGGNDSNNMLVPMDQYSAYASARGSLALGNDTLLPVTGAVSRGSYGFHPAIAEVADLFASRTLGVVANVGRLERPPANTSEARSMFKALSAVDSSLKYAPGGYASPGWSTDDDIVTGFPEGRGTTVATRGMQRGRERQALLQRGIAAGRAIRVSFPGTGIGQQLQQIAGMLAGGADGQVFLAQLGGFATQANQLERQGALLRQLSEAMSAFYQATVELGIANHVVTYTDTEYSRALVPNAKGGTERGWGGHHLVMGGSVIGGDVYGAFPALQANGPQDVTGSGVWLPAISRQQFTGTVASWMGMADPAAPAAGLNFLA